MRKINVQIVLTWPPPIYARDTARSPKYRNEPATAPWPNCAGNLSAGVELCWGIRKNALALNSFPSPSSGVSRAYRRMPSTRCRKLAKIRGKSASLGIFRSSAFWRKCRIRHLRHRFATNALVRWYRAGEDPEVRLPVLSAYLGHVHVADTQWYLEACPELMREAMRRLERRWEGRP